MMTRKTFAALATGILFVSLLPVSYGLAGSAAASSYEHDSSGYDHSQPGNEQDEYEYADKYANEHEYENKDNNSYDDNEHEQTRHRSHHRRHNGGYSGSAYGNGWSDGTHSTPGGWNFPWNNAGRHNRQDSHSIRALLKYKENLKLTDDQVKKLKALNINAKKEAIRLSSEANIMEIDLKAQLHADKPNRAEINKLLESVGKSYASIRKARINSILDAYGLLTADQIAKIREYKKNHNQKDNRHHHR